MMGVSADIRQQGLLTPRDINRTAGLPIHPFDVAGIAILISAGPRVAALLRPAFYGALVAISLRTLSHLLVR